MGLAWSGQKLGVRRGEGIVGEVQHESGAPEGGRSQHHNASSWNAGDSTIDLLGSF